MIWIAMTMAHAAPVELAHQGRLLDAAGGPIEGQLPVAVTLYDGPGSSTVLWSETQTLSFESGFFTAVLGAEAGNPLDSSVFVDAAAWLEVTVDGQAMGRTRVRNVPMAAVAVQAMTAETPSDPGDIANKAYVDASTSDLSTLLRRGEWRENCYDDFSGWNSTEECMRDGRWHLAAEIQTNGTYTVGDYGTLRAMLQQGPDVRVLVNDYRYQGYHLQFHAPDGSGIDNNPAIWIRTQPTPMTYANATQNDFQDKWVLLPNSGPPEWGQSWYGRCGNGITWANYGHLEASGCDIERMFRNNWEGDIGHVVKVFTRY